MIELQVTTRTVAGKQNRGLLAKGIAPGGISRNKADTLMVQLDQISLLPLVRAPGSELIKVIVDGKDVYTTVISELYVNPLSNKVEAFTLTQMIPESHITVSVPIAPFGISPAVKNNLGVLVVNLPALKITAGLNNLIDKIAVDISALLDVGSRILVSDLPGIEKIKLASEKDRTLTVVTIRPLQKVEMVAQVAGAETPVAGEVAAAPAEESK